MRKLLISVFVMIIMMLSFSACGVSGDDPEVKPNEVPEASSEDYIFSVGNPAVLVYDSNAVDDDNVKRLADTITAVTGAVPIEVSPAAERTEHEIVIGRTSRAISDKAYRLLDRMDKAEDEYVRFLIYSDGDSVAIAFDGAALGINAAEEDAIDLFISEYCMEGSLSMKKGIAHQTVYSVIDRQQKLDEVKIAEYWEEAEKSLTELYGAAVSADVIEAMRELYSIYSDDTVSWFANLYDPSVGGFYYSNSARDTEEFLPDLESTAQTLAFLEGTAMLRDAGGSVSEAMPSWLGEEIVAFTKSLQDPGNGYFYHPQWTKTLTDSLLAKRGRDVTNAVNILKRFDAQPTYDTPSGVEGDGIKYDGTPVSYKALPARLGISSVSAVSRIVSVNTDSDENVTPHLRTREAFLEYLDGLDINGRSYSVGNQLESQANQILARDAVLAERGEEYSLCDILADWLTQHQNPRTGTWYLDDTIDYEAVNGILKISSTYHRIKRQVPNADLCMKAAMTVLTDNTEARHVCDILNPWYAITVIRNNLVEHTGDEAEYKALLDDMMLKFSDSVIITKTKLSTLLRDDGSFGYLPDSSAHTQQGAPISVPGMWEGDVNATYIATCISSHMYTALGISDDRVPIYTEADRMRFVYIIERLDPVIKDAPIDERDSANGVYTKKYGGVYYPEGSSTYNLVTVYRYTTEVRHDSDITKQTHEYMQIVTDDVDRFSGVLEYGKASQESYYGVCFGRTGHQSAGNCFVFETEIKINSITEDALDSITGGGLPVLIDLQLAKTTSLTAANVCTNDFYDKIGGIYITEKGGSYTTSFSGSMSNWQYLASGAIGPEIEADSWYTIAFELYDNGIAKYYVNNRYVGEMRVLEDTSVFYEIDTVRLALNSKATGSNIWLDNTFVGNLSKEYTEGDKLINYEGYVFEAGEHYDNFGGLDYEMSGVKALENSGYIVRSTYYTKDNMEGKTREEMTHEYVRIAEETVEDKVHRVLEFTTLESNAQGIYIRETASSKNGDCFVFETDISLTVDPLTAGQMLDARKHYIASLHVANAAAASSVTGKDPNASYTEFARIYAKRDSEGNIRYYINYPYASSSKVTGAEAEITEGWHTFTAEMYSETGYIKYYVDGILIGEYRLSAETVMTSFDNFNAVKISYQDMLNNSTIWLDNTFIGRVDKAYVPDEEPDDTPVQPETDGDNWLGGEDGDILHDPNGWN